MKTVTFGNAFSIRYNRVKTPEGGSYNFTEAEKAEKKAQVGDRFTALVQEITGQETRRVSGQQGDYLLMDGPKGKTLSVYKELEKGLGKGADPEEQAENTSIILEEMQKKGVLSSPKSVTLQYGPDQVADKELVTRKFKEMGFPIVAQKAEEASAPTAESDVPKSYASALKRSYSAAFQTKSDRSGV